MNCLACKIVQRSEIRLFKFQRLILWLILGVYINGTSQTPVPYTDSLDKIKINSYCSVAEFSIRKEASIDTAWRYFKEGHLIPLDHALEKPRFTMGLYDFFIFFVVENISKSDKAFFVKSLHAPVQTYRVFNNHVEPVPYMGHHAMHDPNHLLEIKERNGFTYTMKPESRDTFVYKVNIIEAGESHDFYLYNVATYSIDRLLRIQWATLFNGIFLGILIMFLLSSVYFYFRIREVFLLWYIFYLLVFIFYYWRDLEFWNTQFDLSHAYMSWYVTKVPITFLIFTFYVFFINGILGVRSFSGINRFIRKLLFILPGLWIMDLIFLKVYPYGSILLSYSSGTLMGLIQLSLLIPIWKNSSSDLTTRYLILGSLFLFFGWLTIIFFPVDIHQYTIRIFTLIEMIFFMLAIVERFLKIKNEYIEIKLQKEKSISLERERIAAEMHDELGGDITTIRYLSFNGLDQNTVESKETFRQIGIYTNDLANKISDIIWMFDLKNTSLAQLTYYLHSKISEQLKPYPIAFKLTEPAKHTEIELNSEARRDIILCVKECVNNIIKHAHATRIDLRMHIADINLHIHIKDDGLNSRTGVQNGNGTYNIRKRIAKWSGTVTWESDKGTVVSMSLPLNKIGISEQTYEK